MKIGIIGVGVVGGATAKVLERAHEIYLYDRYKELHNSEKNLEELAMNSESVFVCVPTPMKPSGEIDYSSIHNSVHQLLEASEKNKRNPKELLVIIRSTAVSGTTDELAERYPLKFAFNPEFLREKHALEDMESTDRVVIGADDEWSIKKMLDIYKPLFPNANYIITDRKTAEMIKYAANVMLAGQTGVANQIYQVCKAVGVNYNVVKEAMLLDNRIGRNIEVPGSDGDFGFGGKCFPKDLNALIYLAQEHMCPVYLLREIWRSNLDVRKNKDWLDIPGATSGNNNFTKK